MANVIRQDVVEIGFSSNLTELKKITSGVDDIKKSVSGVGKDDGMEKLKQNADKASVSTQKLSDGLDKVGAGLKKIGGKALTTAISGMKKLASLSFKGLVAGVAGVSAIIAKSVTAFADYEQQVGGVETLFKKSAGTVEKYANDAYKTAGISANDYMRTSTSFAASLLQSLGGDTKKAAEYANQAIIDMADNANKMGTPMENIQNAYQAFAKQNWTLLDNLKLGYGGTKAEMERLVKDAAKLDKTIDASSLSYGNVVKAVHAVQKNLDITGTTAKEANKTISGSLYAMKSAWGNLTTAFVSGGDSLNQCIDNMISSVEVFASNALPAVKKGLAGFGKALAKLAPVISKELPSLLEDTLPSLITAGTTILDGLIKAVVKVLPTVAPQLAGGIVKIVVSLGKTLVNNAGALLTAAKEIAAEVVKALYEGITGKPMGEDAFNNVKTTIDKVFSSIQKIVSGVIQFGGTLATTLAPVLSVIGDLALKAFGWIADNIDWIVPAVGALVGAFLAYKAALVVVNVITGIVSAGQAIMAAVCGTASTAAATGTAAVGTSAATSATQILAFAAAILAVGVAILLICVGFAILAKSAIELSKAGGGAVAILIALVAVIALFAIGAAMLGSALTAGTVGFIAFGAAVLMVGAGFALIGVGALLAAMGLQIIAGILPTIAAYGIQGAASLGLLSIALLAFAVSASLVGLALIPVAASFAVIAISAGIFALSMVLIAASFIVITSMISIFTAAIMTLPAVFAQLIPQVMLFSVALLPFMAVLVAAVIPLTAFTALLVILAVSFTLLAAAALIFLISMTAITVIFTLLIGLIGLLNFSLILMTTTFAIVAAASLLMIPTVAALAVTFFALVAPALAFTLAITPLTALFIALAASFLIVTVSAAALLVLFTGITAMILAFNVIVMLLIVSMITITGLITVFSLSLILLSGIMVIVAPLMLLFTAALIPLAVTLAALVIPLGIATIAFGALMAIMVILAPLSVLLAASLLIMKIAFSSLSKSAPKVAKAIDPLAGKFGKMIIPCGLLAAALTPLALAFAAAAVSAVILLAAVVGLVASMAILVAEFTLITSICGLLGFEFEIIAASSNKLTKSLMPLISALIQINSPLQTSAISFREFGAAALVSCVAVTGISKAFIIIAALSLAVSQGIEAVNNGFATMPVSAGQAAMAAKTIITAFSELPTAMTSIMSKTMSIMSSNISRLIADVTNMPNKMASGIRSSGKSLSDSIVAIWKDAVNASVNPVNKVIEAANWILKQFGSSKQVVSWKPYANGTNGHKGGNALVNDGNGAELVQMPNGASFIPQGKNVFLPNAPKGMKVLPADQTAALMGKKSTSYRYANGIGNIDIWSYIDNASGLVGKIADSVTYSGSGFALDMSKAMVSTITSNMGAWVKKQFDENGAMSIAGYVASKGVEQWRGTVIRALQMTGQYNAANVQRTLMQMQSESGGNPRAINLWDSNAKAGIPSKGLMQCIDPTFNAYAMAGYNKNIYDPLSNILASIRYAVSRYGSLANAYKGHGYANGGIATKPSIFGEAGAEMAIPLSANKKKQGRSLWAQTGSMLGVQLSDYTPENSASYSDTYTTETNTYSPSFNVTISGSADDRATARKVKRWISESLEETFKGMSNKNPKLREV